MTYRKYTHAVYVFRDEQCKQCGFTMFSRRFHSEQEAQEYAKNFAFCEIAAF